MKALQIKRQRRAPRTGSRRVGVGAGGRRAGRAARVHDDRPAGAARAGMAPRAHAAGGHLRLRPVDDRGPRVDLLRRLGELPVRARPRGRRRARRRHPRRPRARARPRRSRASRCRSTAPLPATATTTPTSSPADLEPGIQTGFCCSTGGGWSPRVRGPRVPAAPHRRRRARRASRAHRAAGRRHPRRPARRPVDGGTAADRPGRRRARRRHDGPRRDRRAACATCPTSASSSAPATRTSSAMARRSAPTTSCRPASSPRPCGAIVGCHVIGDHLLARAPTPRSTPSAPSDSIADALAITRPRGRVVLMGMPAEVTARPDRAVAPRDRAGRRLHLRHRDAPDGGRVAHVRPRHRDRRRHRGRAVAVAPRTPSPTTSTPSPTPPPPAGAARSRSPSTSDLTGDRLTCPVPDSSSRSTAPRRRRCSGAARASASSSYRADRSRVIYPPEPLAGDRRHRRRHPPRPAAPDRPGPAAGAAVPGHAAHDRLRRRQPAAAQDASPRHPPTGHRGRARPRRRGRRRRRPR